MLLGFLFRKNIKQLDDQSLLVMVRSDDQRAMGELFERYSFLVMGQCLKYLQNKMNAEDEMMNIFNALPEKIKRSEIANFKTWLYSVSRNECLMKLRKKEIKETDAESALLFTDDSSESELQLAVLTDAKLNLLENAIGSLSDEQQLCIRLFYIENKSYDEITSITKFEIGKVKSYIQNGKRNLKLTLESQREFKA